MKKQSFEKGQMYKIPVDCIYYEDGESKSLVKVLLKETKYFDVIYDRALHPKHFYLFSCDGGKKLQIVIEISNGETLSFRHVTGGKTIEEAAERIGKEIGSAYGRMKGKQLKELLSTEEKIRAHLQKLGYGEEDHQFIEESVQEQLERSHRRRIIYTWYQENCVGFDD